MTGFVKLRRGLAEHVRSRSMTLVEHGAYTLLLQLADYSTGRWRGTQRSFAFAAGISSGLSWKILTSLERKGYLLWDREKKSVQICKFFVEKAAEDPEEKPVEKKSLSPALSHRRDHVGHGRDHLIRNTRTLLKKTEIVHPSLRISGCPSHLVREDQSQKPTAADSDLGCQISASVKSDLQNRAAPVTSVLAEFFEELRRLADAKSFADGASESAGCRRRGISKKNGRFIAAGWDLPPP